MKNIIALCGSVRAASSNHYIIDAVQRCGVGKFNVLLFHIATLPYFNPDIDNELQLPETVKLYRELIKGADGVLICTPEYVFTLPGCLKNALEWLVSTTIMSGKPAALITAAAHGAQAHESLQLVVRTLEAKFGSDTTLLIQGVRGKVLANGTIKSETVHALSELSQAFHTLMTGNSA